MEVDKRGGECKMEMSVIIPTIKIKLKKINLLQGRVMSYLCMCVHTHNLYTYIINQCIYKNVLFTVYLFTHIFINTQA